MKRIHPRARPRRQRGFTLIEIMAVVVIMGLLMGIVGTAVFGRINEARRTTTMAQIEQLPKDTPIAFYCHTGGRSRAAAEHFLKQGFKVVYNLAGGIDAWSRDVDASVKRY